MRARDQSGQASVELLAVLPILALVGLIALQVVLGAGWWMQAAGAARSAARAGEVGASEREAARAALPAPTGGTVRLVSGARDLTVRVDLPSIVTGFDGRGVVRATQRRP